MASEDFDDAVREWVARTREVKSLEESLAKTQKALKEAGNKLAELIVPSDVGVGETICVWVRTGYREENLVKVVMHSTGIMDPGAGPGTPSYDVSFRGKPRTVDEDGNVGD